MGCSFNGSDQTFSQGKENLTKFESFIEEIKKKNDGENRDVLVKPIGLWCFVSLCLYSHQFVSGDHTWQALPFADPVLLSVRVV